MDLYTLYRIERPEISADTYGLNLQQRRQRIYKGGKTVSSASSIGKVGQLHVNQ